MVKKSKTIEKVEMLSSPFIKLLRDPNRFKKLEDGWVRDTLVGVEWGPCSGKYLTFKQAQDYCAKLGGRLPEINELQSLVDYTKREPAIDKTLFPDTKSSWYWTGTEVVGVASCAWCVDFVDGLVSSGYKDYVFFVRPVRASQ